MKYIPAIDGLRGVAILVVLASHLLGDGIVPGGFGVTLFFFISGYLITEILVVEYAASGSISIPDFYIRRFRRLAPALLTMISIVTIIYWLIGRPVSLPETSAAAFYYINYFSIAGGYMAQPFGTLWSLAVEEHFYLLYPAVLLVGLRKPHDLLYFLIGLCAAILVWRCILVANGADALRTYSSTDTRIDSILYGAILALLVRAGLSVSRKMLSIGLGISAVFIIASLSIRGAVFRETFRYSLQGLSMLPVFYAVLFDDRVAKMRISILENPLLLWVGKISYSLYLWHFPVLALSLLVLPSTSIFKTLTVVVMFAVAALSYYAVELPLRHRRSLPATALSQKTS